MRTGGGGDFYSLDESAFNNVSIHWPEGGGRAGAGGGGGGDGVGVESRKRTEVVKIKKIPKLLLRVEERKIYRAMLRLCALGRARKKQTKKKEQSGTLLYKVREWKKKRQ